MKKYFCKICQIDIVLTKLHSQIVEDSVSIGQDGQDRQEMIQMFCPNRTQHYQIVLDGEYKELNMETKQKFLDLFKSGKTIGECRNVVNISLDMACEILKHQMIHIPLLDFEVKK